MSFSERIMRVGIKGLATNEARVKTSKTKTIVPIHLYFAARKISHWSSLVIINTNQTLTIKDDLSVRDG